jgi:hypothetical protein
VTAPPAVSAPSAPHPAPATFLQHHSQGQHSLVGSAQWVPLSQPVLRGLTKPWPYREQEAASSMTAAAA